MKTSLFTFGALVGLASAQNAIVYNNCDTTVYVQSYPTDGSAPGPLTTVAAGEAFSEEFRVSGSVRYSILFGLHNTPHSKGSSLGIECIDCEDRQDKDSGYASLLWLFILVQPRLRVL